MHFKGYSNYKGNMSCSCMKGFLICLITTYTLLKSFKRFSSCYSPKLKKGIFITVKTSFTFRLSHGCMGNFSFTNGNAPVRNYCIAIAREKLIATQQHIALAKFTDRKIAKISEFSMFLQFF